MKKKSDQWPYKHAEEPEESSNDMDLFIQWSGQVDMVNERNDNAPVDGPTEVWPLEPKINWADVARELLSELNAKKFAIKRLEQERDALKSGMAVNREDAAKAQEANADLLAKAESLLNEKKELSQSLLNVTAEVAKERQARISAEVAKGAADKEAATLRGELLSANMIGARLMGYIEALEDQAPPVMKPEPRESVLDRIGRFHFSNRPPGW